LLNTQQHQIIDVHHLGIYVRNALLISLLLPLFILTGCGGSSNSSSANGGAVYNWQIVHLKTVSEEDIEEDCIIFGVSPSDSSEVITASVANINYNILFHNADGSLLDDYTITSSDIGDNGIASIDSGLLPTGGYISLEEVESSLSDQSNVYIFSVEKSLLSDLVLNVRLPQTGSECYQGDDYRVGTISDTAAVSVLEEENITYYQTSYSNDLVSGRSISSNIPVLSSVPAEKDTLVTAFLSNENDQNTELAYYAFVDFSYIYDTTESNTITSSSLSNADLIPMHWQFASNLSVGSSSSIDIIHSDNTYTWQHLYEDNDQFTIAADSELIDQWAAVFSGEETTTGWQFDSFNPISDSASSIELEIPEVYAIDEMALLENCTIEDNQTDYCIDADASFDPDDYSIQRSHIRLLSHSDSRIMYQTIYGLPKLQQPILESSSLDIQPSSTTRIEIALVDGQITQDKLDYFMSKHLDVNVLAESSTASDFHDVNGYVTTSVEDNTLYQSILMTDVTIIQHAVE
jgi:hypothetical protein